MPSPFRRRRGASNLGRNRRARRGCLPELLELEARLPLAGPNGVGPTFEEQYMLELINRARANPAAEGRRLLLLAQTNPDIHAAVSGWNLNAFSQYVSSLPALPPLAFNPRLIAAADAETARMIADNVQEHSPPGFLTDPNTATASDGQAYYPTGMSYWHTGENIYAFSAGVHASLPRDVVDFFHAAFLLDWGNPNYVHFWNTLAPGPAEAGTLGRQPFSEIGISLNFNAHPTVPPPLNPPDPATAGLNVGPALVTEEFGWRSLDPSDLTGVVYQDRNHNDFYDPGEGIGGVSIVAVGQSGQGTFSTATWDSGGYTLPLPAGTYSVTASGGGLSNPQTRTVSIGADNVEWNVVDRPGFQAAAVPGGSTGPSGFAILRPANDTWYVEPTRHPYAPLVVSGGAPALAPTDAQAVTIGEVGPRPILYQKTTSTFTVSGVGSIQFGQGTLWGGNPTPFAGDFLGDGRIEVGVFQPRTSTFYIQGLGAIQFGQGIADGGYPIPVVADFRGDGTDQIAVFQPNTSTFYIRGDGAYQFGQGWRWGGNPIPVVADYAGTGRAQLAVYQPSTSTYYVQGLGATQFGQGWYWGGNPLPIVGDFSGDGKADYAVYQQDSGVWYVNPADGSLPYMVPFGLPGLDLPATGKFDFGGSNLSSRYYGLGPLTGRSALSIASTASSASTNAAIPPSSGLSLIGRPDQILAAVPIPSSDPNEPIVNPVGQGRKHEAKSDG